MSSEVSIESIEDVVVATLMDRKLLDEEKIQVVGKQLLDLAYEGRHQKIAVDMSRVEYMSSAFLGKMISLDYTVKSYGGRWILCGVRSDILENLKITRLNLLISVVLTKAEAVCKLRAVAGGAGAVVQVGCPIGTCEGVGESIHGSEPSLPKMVETWDQTCNRCGAFFTVTGSWPAAGQSSEASVCSFKMATYESESIHGFPSARFVGINGSYVSLLKLDGRLDLYSMQILETALGSLPPSLATLIDLRISDGFSVHGIRRLSEVLDQDRVRRSILILPRSLSREFGARFQHAPTEQKAIESLGEIGRDCRAPRMRVVVRRL